MIRFDNTKSGTANDLVEKIQEKELDVSEYLLKNNIRTLQYNALDLVVQEQTSIEEIYPILIS